MQGSLLNLVLHRAGKKYASPTAFTVAVKRQAAPAGRQGNDGWRSTLYEGAPLEKYRKQFATAYNRPPEDELEVRACGRNQPLDL